MLFLTYWFVWFIIFLYPLYWAVRRPIARLLILTVACAIFHTHFAGPAGVLPIIALATLTYLAGLSRQKWACYAVIVLCVLSLVFYKYTKFLCVEVVGSLSPSLRKVLVQEHSGLTSIAAPLAISFFVFEFVHYLVDVCRGGQSIRNPLYFTLYSIFWPSIVAGPVKRYQDFMPALEAGVRQVNSDDVATGLIRVALGLGKKIVADNLTAILAYNTPDFANLDFGWRWAFVVGIAMRILLDFSGYSDMAIGFARMHGIRLMENFNWPYLATSITNFWHRWHISLSTWIRDYIYIAMGGGRCGRLRKIANGLLAFGICGLWHGAGWNFLFWGIYHGVGLAVSANYRSACGSAGAALAAILEKYQVIAWLMTMVYVCIGWLFFFYPVGQAWQMVQLLFTVAGL
jgi:alginate O-acetyltransferase complex protein AlgI